MNRDEIEKHAWKHGIEPARAKGGYWVHAKLVGAWSAVCGHAPSAPKGILVRDRCGWHRIVGTAKQVNCPKCLARLAVFSDNEPRYDIK